MKIIRNQFGRIAAAGLFLLAVGGCTTVRTASSPVVYDDLYGSHDRERIAQYEAQEREQMQRAAEAARAEYARYTTGNPYADILEETYEGAYARRLRGFESPTYRMPASYYNYLYSDAAAYASAYDPAFYNVIVMGDEVWVEPKYITSMFGYRTSPSVSLSFGWGRPYWRDPWYRGWNDPWYWGWNYPSYWWGAPPHWGRPRPPVHRPPGIRPPIQRPPVTNRPTTSRPGGGSTTGGGTSGSRPGITRPGTSGSTNQRSRTDQQGTTTRQTTPSFNDRGSSTSSPAPSSGGGGGYTGGGSSAGSGGGGRGR